MKKTIYLLVGTLVSPILFAAQNTTISTLAEFIALQDLSDQNITMKAGTYHITSETKSLFSGGDWRANVIKATGSDDIWPGLFKFTGSNNTFDLTGVTFTFESTILEELPNKSHGSLIELSGTSNVWKGFDFEEVPNDNGEYGEFINNSGGAMLAINGSDHYITDLTLKSRFSRPYGFGALYGKTGSSKGMLPNLGLSKKSGLYITELTNTRFENVVIDHSGFGH